MIPALVKGSPQAVWTPAGMFSTSISTCSVVFPKDTVLYMQEEDKWEVCVLGGEGGHNGKTWLHALSDLSPAQWEGCISSFCADVTSHMCHWIQARPVWVCAQLQLSPPKAIVFPHCITKFCRVNQRGSAHNATSCSQICLLIHFLSLYQPRWLQSHAVCLRTRDSA